MDLSTKIVLHLWVMREYEGVGYGDPKMNYKRFARADLEEFMDAWVDEHADEDFDNKAFVIFATPGIRKKLDWESITKKAEDYAWRFFVCDLFREDDDCADDDYNALWDEIYNDTDFEW